MARVPRRRNVTETSQGARLRLYSALVGANASHDASMIPTPAGNQSLTDRLLSARQIPPALRERAIEHAIAHQKRIEDAVLDLDIVTEADLLRFLSMQHNTQFVSTEKLHKANVDPTIVSLAPAKLAEVRCVMPVLYSSKDDTLSYVTADPDDVDIAKEVRLAASVKNVKPLLARPAAIRAAIRRSYHADAAPFDMLLAQVKSSATPPVASRARSSSTWPTSTSAVMTAAASK